MRSTLLLLTTVLLARAQAQSFPFPTSDATWVQYFEVMISPPPVPQFAWMSTANFCVDGSDTLITGTSYTQLHHCTADYVGGLRESDGAVFFYPADSTQEYLLYDFGAAVGDTLYGIYVNEELGLGGSSGWMGAQLLDVKVTDSAPNPNYGGRIGVQVQALYPLIGMDSEWIEGMGCMHGLFTFNPLNISDYWYGLDCFSHDGTTYWNSWYTETSGTCAPQYMSVAERNPMTARAYPNPTVGLVRVAGMGTAQRITVRDALGRSVAVPVSWVPGDVLELDLSQLPTGLYIAHDQERRAAIRLYKH